MNPPLPFSQASENNKRVILEVLARHLTRGDSVLEIGLNRAVALLADAPRKPAPKEIGAHPKDGKPITIRQGRWGPFVQHGRTRAAIPKNTNADDLTVAAAAELIAAKGGQKAKAPAKKKAKAAAKKKAKSKAANTAPAEKAAEP